MGSKLRKDGAAFADRFVLAGGTATAPPPSTRLVRQLRVTGMDRDNSPEGLAPLAVYPDLEVVEIDNPGSALLGDLSGVAVRSIVIAGPRVGEVDLTGLGSAPALEVFRVLYPSALRSDAPITLPRTLRELSLGDRGAAGAPWLASLVEGIDWSEVPRLQRLALRVREAPFPTIDLSFTAGLGLEQLELFGIFPTDAAALRRDVASVTGADDASLALYRELGGEPAAG